ncbi:MAG: hypothetical protein OCC49_01050 [Fibrobacterales bacterium]
MDHKGIDGLTVQAIDTGDGFEKLIDKLKVQYMPKRSENGSSEFHIYGNLLMPFRVGPSR